VDSSIGWLVGGGGGEGATVLDTVISPHPTPVDSLWRIEGAHTTLFTLFIDLVYVVCSQL
jgi:hypothetical protein